MVKWCYDCLLIGSDGASQVSKSAQDQDAHNKCSYAAAKKCSSNKQELVAYQTSGCTHFLHHMCQPVLEHDLQCEATQERKCWAYMQQELKTDKEQDFQKGRTK
eukprot:4156276-Ditylum_brightwellii.AAC.1